jgi:hypothetical protein
MVLNGRIKISIGTTNLFQNPVLRIHMLLGLLDPDPDPLVRGMDPDADPFYHQAKIER